MSGASRGELINGLSRVPTPTKPKEIREKISYLPKIMSIIRQLENRPLVSPNGFTEGCNNKIKVLKRNAYGYQNFKRFRNRILHIFSHQQPQTQQAAA